MLLLALTLSALLSVSVAFGLSDIVAIFPFPVAQPEPELATLPRTRAQPQTDATFAPRRGTSGKAKYLRICQATRKPLPLTNRQMT